jgi:hypothetical protein
VQYRLSLDKPLDVLKHCVHLLRLGPSRPTADMRRQNDIVTGQEGIAVRQRFAHEDIEPGASNAAGLQHLN